MGEVTVTLKYSGAHDAPWIVYRAASNPEMAALLDGGPGDLYAAIGRAQASFKAEGTLGELLGARAVGAAPAAAPASQGYAAPAAPAGAVKSCPHGTKVYKSGISQKNNKPWGRWDCPLPKGDPNACPAEWAKL